MGWVPSPIIKPADPEDKAVIVPNWYPLEDIAVDSIVLLTLRALAVIKELLSPTSCPWNTEADICPLALILVVKTFSVIVIFSDSILIFPAPPATVRRISSGAS